MQLPGVNSSKQAAQNDEATAGMPNSCAPAAAQAQAASPGVEAPSPGVPVSEGTRNRATRRGEVRSLPNEAILSAIEISSIPLYTRKLANQKFPLAMLCEIAGAVLDPETGKLLEYRHLTKKPQFKEVWSKTGSKEIGRLAQGVPGVVDGTNTIFFIDYDQIPNDRSKDVTYTRICVNF